MDREAFDDEISALRAPGLPSAYRAMLLLRLSPLEGEEEGRGEPGTGGQQPRQRKGCREQEQGGVRGDPGER